MNTLAQILSIVPDTVEIVVGSECTALYTSTFRYYVYANSVDFDGNRGYIGKGATLADAIADEKDKWKKASKVDVTVSDTGWCTFTQQTENGVYTVSMWLELFLTLYHNRYVGPVENLVMYKYQGLYVITRDYNALFLTATDMFSLWREIVENPSFKAPEPYEPNFFEFIR